VNPNPAGVLAPALALIVQRVQRLEEWTQFEAIVCDIRDALERFHDRLQKRLSADRKMYRHPDRDAPEVRREWEQLYLDHLAPLKRFGKQIHFITAALDDDDQRAARTWIDQLTGLAATFEAIFADGSVPKLLGHCLTFRETVRGCLSDHLEVVRWEITELRLLSQQVQRGVVAAPVAPPAPPPPAPPQHQAGTDT
jgi:hypothetical protein